MFASRPQQFFLEFSDRFVYKYLLACLLINYESCGVKILRQHKMEDEKSLKDARERDPFVDRRSGEDRRKTYDLDYFQNGGVERRKGPDRRQQDERRDGCVRVSKWSSVCKDS
jgi:hypothetical protein